MFRSKLCLLPSNALVTIMAFTFVNTVFYSFFTFALPTNKEENTTVPASSKRKPLPGKNQASEAKRRRILNPQEDDSSSDQKLSIHAAPLTNPLSPNRKHLDVFGNLIIQYLHPKQYFNFALTCKEFVPCLNNVPMWGDLIKKSNVPLWMTPSSSARRDFMVCLEDNHLAKYNYAEHLLSNGFGKNTAIKQLITILTATDLEYTVSSKACNLIIHSGLKENMCSTLHMYSTLHIYSRISLRLSQLDSYHKFTQRSQNQSLTVKDRANANYSRGMMRVEGHIGEELLTDADAYDLLTQSSQNKSLTVKDRANANYSRGMMRIKGHIGEELLTDADAYDLLTQSSQNKSLTAKIKRDANCTRGLMRAQGRIGENILTYADAYQLLNQSSQSQILPASNRKIADYFRGSMRAANQIGEELLTDADAYLLLTQSCQNPGISVKLRVRAFYYRGLMRALGRIEEGILTNAKAHQFLTHCSQDQRLTEMERKDAEFYRRMMEGQGQEHELEPLF
jgi:Arc/MetJ family transcription regulator